MSRTPWSHRVDRLTRTLGRAARAGRDPAEQMELDRALREGSWSRRRLLGALAAAPLVGATPLAGCAPGTKDVGGSGRVVIVGGGMAGLACCHRLAQAGVRADVYEASADRLGGRMWTGTGLFAGGAGLTTELGGEFVDSIHTELRSLADELGFGLLDTYVDDELDVVYWFGGQRHDPRDILAGLNPVYRACNEALATLDGGGADISYATPSGAEALDALSVTEFLAGVDCDDVIRSLLDVYMTTEYGIDADELSSINLLFSMVQEGDGADERYKIEGGNDQVPLALAALYEDRIHLDKALVAVSEGSDGAYTLTFADGSEVTADIVVLAIPFTTLREVDLTFDMPDVKRRAIDELGYGTNAKLVQPYAGRPWRDAGDDGEIDTDDVFQVTWDSAQPQATDFGILANFVGGSHGVAIGEGSVADQARVLVDAVDAVWPGSAALAGSDPQRIHWPTEPWVKASYASYRLGQWTSIGGAEGQPVGRVYFCGEHTSAEFQGYMNGAAQTGADVAATIVSLLGGTERRYVPRASRRRPYRGAPTGRATG